MASNTDLLQFDQSNVKKNASDFFNWRHNYYILYVNTLLAVETHHRSS